MSSSTRVKVNKELNDRGSFKIQKPEIDMFDNIGNMSNAPNNKMKKSKKGGNVSPSEGYLIQSSSVPQLEYDNISQNDRFDIQS